MVLCEGDTPVARAWDAGPLATTAADFARRRLLTYQPIALAPFPPPTHLTAHSPHRPLTSPPNASLPTASLPNASPPDASPPDASTPDASTPDASTSHRPSPHRPTPRRLAVNTSQQVSALLRSDPRVITWLFAGVAEDSKQRLLPGSLSGSSLATSCCQPGLCVGTPFTTRHTTHLTGCAHSSFFLQGLPQSLNVRR